MLWLNSIGSTGHGETWDSTSAMTFSFPLSTLCAHPVWPVRVSVFAVLDWLRQSTFSRCL